MVKICKFNFGIAQKALKNNANCIGILALFITGIDGHILNNVPIDKLN